MKFIDRARMNTTTTGTGTITVGSAVLGYQTFSSAGAADQDVLRYTIEDGTAWEIGFGTYTVAGTTLTRNYVASSTGALLNLTGNAQVFGDAIAADISIYRRAVNDTAVTVTAADRFIAFTNITATRVATLPPANTFPTGTRLMVIDESGLCNGVKLITINVTGTDKINGVTTYNINVAFGYATLISDNSSKWTVIDGGGNLTVNNLVVKIGAAFPANAIALAALATGTAVISISGSAASCTGNSATATNVNATGIVNNGTATINISGTAGSATFVNATGIINNGTAGINISGTAAAASSVNFNAGLTTTANVTFGTTTINGTSGAYTETITYKPGVGGVGSLYFPAAAGSTAIQFVNGGGAGVGNITLTGSATAYNTSSDADLKTVHGPADTYEALKRILQIKLHYAAYNDEPDSPRTMVLAHELEDVMPHMVTGKYRDVKPAMVLKEGMPGYEEVSEDYVYAGPPIMEQVYQGVDYSKAVPDIWAAMHAMNDMIQKQQAIIDSLMKKVK